MAAGGPVQELCEELSCSICLEHFKDPVMLTECGHNFCRACLIRSWGEPIKEASCPQCRETVQPSNLKPNRQLANVVEIAQKLSLRGEGGAERKGVEGKGRTCEKHQEPLKLFCRDDEAPICVVCDRSKEHRQHRLVPVEEAAQEYKDQFCDSLELLRKERLKSLVHTVDIVGKSQDLLGQTEFERQKMVAEFRKMHEFLEEQEKLLLGQVEEVEKEIAREKDKHLARLSKELSCLESLIQEMQEKVQQPATEFLQDARSTLQRYEKKETFRNPITFIQKLTWKIQGLHNRTISLEDNLNQFKDTLASELQVQKDPVQGLHPQQRRLREHIYWRTMAEDPAASVQEPASASLFLIANTQGTISPMQAMFEEFKSSLQRDEKKIQQGAAANVILDPSTANPYLILSEDQRSVRRGSKVQELPKNPERFDICPVVLGCEGFMGGCHFWEFSVGSEDGWSVGVAKKSVRRKGLLTFSPEGGI